MFRVQWNPKLVRYLESWFSDVPFDCQNLLFPKRCDNLPLTKPRDHTRTYSVWCAMRPSTRLFSRFSPRLPFPAMQLASREEAISKRDERRTEGTLTSPSQCTVQVLACLAFFCQPWWIFHGKQLAVTDRQTRPEIRR